MLKTTIEGIEEVLGAQEWRVLGDENRQVLGHFAGFDGFDAHALEGMGKLHHLGRFVHLAAIRQALSPRIDRRDRVGRGLITFLVLAIVAGDGAVRGFGLDRFAIGCHQHRGHQA